MSTTDHWLYKPAILRVVTNYFKKDDDNPPKERMLAAFNMGCVGGLFIGSLNCAIRMKALKTRGHVILAVARPFLFTLSGAMTHGGATVVWSRVSPLEKNTPFSLVAPSFFSGYVAAMHNPLTSARILGGFSVAAAVVVLQYVYRLNYDPKNVFRVNSPYNNTRLNSKYNVTYERLENRSEFWKSQDKFLNEKI